MTWLYVVRHGQADHLGKDYDQLTDLGKRQSQLLGEYFFHQNIEFDACITGSLNRQKQTAQEILNSFAKQDACTPPLTENALWDEFEPRLWIGIANRIKHVDPKFSDLLDKYKQFQQNKDPQTPQVFQMLIERILYDWVMNIWEGIEPYTFLEFRNRIERALDQLPNANSILVVSSSTPCALTMGIINQTQTERIPIYMKYINNTSLSVYKKNDLYGWEVVSFNGVPHLGNHIETTIG